MCRSETIEKAKPLDLVRVFCFYSPEMLHFLFKFLFLLSCSVSFTMQDKVKITKETNSMWFTFPKFIQVNSTRELPWL